MTNPDTFSLCFAEDEFVREKCVWIATLSDGREVWQDDDRKGLGERSAWLRLRHYLHINPDIAIVKLRVKFWTHEEIVSPANAPAYYFIQEVYTVQSLVDARTFHSYIFGWLNEETGRIDCVKWAIPEIIPTEESSREFHPDDPSVIINEEFAGKFISHTAKEENL